MADLGTLPGDIDSSAASINDRGEIVGWSQSFTVMRAVIYVNGQIYDLNALIDPTSPLAAFVHLDEAVAINSRGWIAANGTDSRGDQHAYLLIRGDVRDLR
jgi:probable HAF family extracellular repeat protein